MKIDILIAGAFPESTDYTNITDSIFRIESIFGKKGHHLNFKYHTWMAPNILNNLVPDTSHVTRLRDQLRITRSPKVYNGYDIENDKFMSTNEWKNSRKRLKGKPNNHLLHILSVSELLINVRDLPDLYIVVKWEHYCHIILTMRNILNSHLTIQLLDLKIATKLNGMKTKKD